MAAVGRNEPCPCGSGKKYKNCCALKKDRTSLGSLVVAALIALALLTGGLYLVLSLNAG